HPGGGGPPRRAPARRRGRCPGTCRRRPGRGTAGRPPSRRRPRGPPAGTVPAAPGGSGSRPCVHGLPAMPAPAPAPPHVAPQADPQPQEPTRFDLLDAPEVHRVPDPQPPRVAAPTPQADPAHLAVDRAPDPPGEGERVPAVLPADRLHDLPQPLGGRARPAD